jgi:hypothetical protein
MALAKKRTSAGKRRGLSAEARRVDASASRVHAAVVTRSGVTAPMSPYAIKVLKIFKKGVQAELKFLAKRGIATVATVDGRHVRAVPRKVAGRYVLVAPAEGMISERRARPLSRSPRR